MKPYILNLFTIAFTIILSVAISPSFSQTSPQRVLVGINGGVHFPNFSIKELPTGVDITGQDGFYAGINVVIPIGPKLYFQPELNLLGSRIQSYKPFDGLFIDYLGHLNVPLLIKLKGKHFGIYAGPVIGALLFAKDNSGSAGSYDIKYNYHNTNISGMIGAEFTFRYRLGLEVRYQQGFSNIVNGDGDRLINYPTDQNIKLSGLQAGIFYRFGRKP